MGTNGRCGRSGALLFLVVAQGTLGAGGALAQARQQSNAAEREAAPSAVVVAAQDIALARQLALYGQRTGKPEPFLAAARILAETPYRDAPMTPAPQAAQAGAAGAPMAEKAPTPALSAVAMLAAAREAARGDAHALAVADGIEASLEKGRVGGPAVHNDRIYPDQTHSYTISFTGGEAAIIEVVGDGDTDLDCWVYDENGNLIDSDTDYTDYCVLGWTPSWTGEFQLQIKNYGTVWNGYVITTN
jgi:hypothetical protein